MTARTILIVDDDADVRAIVEMSLELGAGWRVVGEGDGRAAVSRAAETRPDAILLDVNLDGTDGPAVLSELRGDPRTAAIPVIFLTANARPDETARLERQGARVLAKPFDPMTLPANIASLLEWTHD